MELYIIYEIELFLSHLKFDQLCIGAILQLDYKFPLSEGIRYLLGIE